MEIFGIIIGVVIGLFGLKSILKNKMMQSHLRWLEQQTPIGTWKCIQDGTTIFIQFEGEPHEGTYKQVMDTGSEQIREFGHWKVSLNELSIMIMATDIKEHPRFGVDTQYTIRYVGPQSIKITGPDRADLVFNRSEEPLPADFDTPQ